MTGRRLWYLAALFGCWVFYIAYGEWFSWLALMIVGGLPWLSLLISIRQFFDFGKDIRPFARSHTAWLLSQIYCRQQLNYIKYAPAFQGFVELYRKSEKYCEF